MKQARIDTVLQRQKVRLAMDAGVAATVATLVAWLAFLAF